MKKINQKTHTEPKMIAGLEFYSFDDIVKKNMRSKEFKLAYEAAQASRRLVQQLRDARIEKHLTQKKLAERLSMPQSVIARMESGRHSVSIDTIRRVASVFGKELQLV